MIDHTYEAKDILEQEIKSGNRERNQKQCQK